ncbi:MAG: hypothetical protein IKQ10_04305 [Oscillospiraceae bacterium]|nr:hypothetical protein [Oscillospiraceae bacterium]
MEIRTHAVILSGDGETTKNRARELAAAALCEGAGQKPCRACRHCRKVFRGEFPGIHPDVICLERQRTASGSLRREILVDQIRALDADAAVLPNEAERKVYILPEADTMNPSAQNAFLKLLEEPPAHVSFVLCVQRSDALLPTVRSRCALERMTPREEDADPDVLERARGYLAARDDRSALVRWAAAQDKLDNASLLAVVGCARETAVGSVPEGEILFLEDFLGRAEEYLRANVGVKHVTWYLATYVFDRK